MSFHERYSDEQREVLAVAYVDRRVRPARRVVELAAAGELELDGERLPSFEAKESTVRTLGSALVRRRAGLATSRLAAAPPGDAVEALRRRLVCVAELGVTELERIQRRRKGGVDFERLRQAARAVREIAALPGPGEPRPPAPGTRVDGQRNGGETRGGLAAEMIAAMRVRPPASPEPRRDVRPQALTPPGSAREDGAVPSPG